MQAAGASEGLVLGARGPDSLALGRLAVQCRWELLSRERVVEKVVPRWPEALESRSLCCR